MSRSAERAFRLAWVAMLVFVQSRFLDTWELIHDDSNTLFAANRFLHEWYWLGPKTSVGIPHFPFVYLLWSLFLRISYTTTAGP